jgi:hypothetical protein
MLSVIRRVPVLQLYARLYKPNLLVPKKQEFLSHRQVVFYYIGCPRKSANTLNIFVDKINRARIVHFLPHETATQKVFPHLSPFHCTST